MKKRIFTLLAVTAMIFAILCSCTPEVSNPPCATCKDDDKNHICDVCQKALGACADSDNDHKCDTCEKPITSCSDTDNDHTCNTCKKPLSSCADTNSDNKCDVCNLAMGSSGGGDQGGGDQGGGDLGGSHNCADGNGDHICDSCDEVATECEDNEDNGFCDICGGVMPDYNGDGSTLDPNADIDFIGISETADEEDITPCVYVSLSERAKTVYFIFTQIPEGEINIFEDGIYGYNGSFTVKDGFVKGGRYVVPVYYEAPSNELCRAFSPNVSYGYMHSSGSVWTRTEGFNMRRVPNGDKPNLLGVNTTGSTTEFQNTISVSTDDIPTFLYFILDGHICPDGFYGDVISGVGVKIYQRDGYYIVRYPLTRAIVGTTALDFYGYYGKAQHSTYRNVATVIITAGEIGDEGGANHVCMDDENDGDHRCEYCGSSRTTNCTDVNNDHVCDECGETKTKCFDATADGLCDICGKAAYSSDGEDDGSDIIPEAYLICHGAALCDNGEFKNTIFFLDGSKAYKFYLAFSGIPSSINLTDEQYGGTFSYGEGFVKEGKYIIPVTYTSDEELICKRLSFDIRFNGNTTSSLYVNVTKNLETPNFLGASNDGNIENTVDSFTFTEIESETITKDIYLHFDGPIFANYFDFDYTFASVKETTYDDGIFTVRISVYYAYPGAGMATLNTFYGPSIDLYYYYKDLFLITVTEKESGPCEKCYDGDGDGYCDVCKNPVDAGGINPPICKQCYDGDGDGLCDACKNPVDAGGINPPICKECYDGDGDGYCDVCKNPTDNSGTVNPPSCEKCIDNDGDGRCDSCHSMMNGSSCESCVDENYDGYCENCHLMLPNYNEIFNPYFIGAATAIGDSFFESHTIVLTYGVDFTLYLKFNTEVRIENFSFLGNQYEFKLESQDFSGFIYSAEISAPDRLFGNQEITFNYSNGYANGLSALMFAECMPDIFPDFLGMVVNGAISSDTPILPAGESYTLQFALTAEIGDIIITVDGSSEIEVLEIDCDYLDEYEYYLYTVSFADSMYFASDCTNYLTMHFTYCGASTQDYNSIIAPLGLYFVKQEYRIADVIEINGVTVTNNGYADKAANGEYVISVFLNMPTTKALLETEGMSFECDTLEMEVTEHGFKVSFTVSGISEYTTSLICYLTAYSGEYCAPIGHVYITLMDTPPGDGGEGDGTNPPICESCYDGDGDSLCDSCKNPVQSGDSPEILSVYNDETGELVKNNIMHVSANGKADFKITYSTAVSTSYILYNGNYYLGYAHESEINTYLYDVCLPIQMRYDFIDTTTTLSVDLYAVLDDGETHLATYECVQELGAFYGIYKNTTEVDRTQSRPTSVTATAGRDTTVYVATNVDFSPEQISIVGSSVSPIYGWNIIYKESFGIYFFEITVPGEMLTLESEMTYKLWFLVDDSISTTFVINVK